MDYLLVRNYVQVGDICYRDEDGSEVIIKDRYARDIFGMILQMSEKPELNLSVRRGIACFLNR